MYVNLDINLFETQGSEKNSAELFVRYDNTLPINTWSKLKPGGDFFHILLPSPGIYHILIKGKKSSIVNLQAHYAAY